MNMIWPIALIVLSNTFYQICAKSTPDAIDPLASLVVTYLVGAVVSLVLYFVLAKDANLIREYRHLNWTSIVLGLAIVGLEAGSLYMYKAGWQISIAQFVCSALLAVVLIIVGRLFYHEAITVKKVLGIVLCAGGLFLLTR